MRFILLLLLFFSGSFGLSSLFHINKSTYNFNNRFQSVGQRNGRQHYFHILDSWSIIIINSERANNVYDETLRVRYYPCFMLLFFFKYFNDGNFIYRLGVWNERAAHSLPHIAHRQLII